MPWALAACAAAALCLDLSAFHRHHNADSLVPVLVSLIRWTPFYWDQDRFGMLAPLLALPFQGVLANLLVQYGLLCFAFFAAHILLARYLWADARWPLAGSLGATAMVMLIPGDTLMAIVHNPFSPSLALGAAGLLAIGDADRPSAPRLGAGLVLLLASSWVNAGAALILGPLALARAWAFGLRRGTLWPLGAIGLSSLAGYLALRLAPFRATMLNPISPAEWPTAFAGLARNAWKDFGTAYWSFLGAAGLAALLLAVAALRRRSAQELRAALAALGAALLYALTCGALRWVHENGFSSRYLQPSIFVLQTCLLLAAMSALPAVFDHRRRTLISVAGAAMVAAIVIRYGPPRPNKLGEDLADNFGSLTEELLAADCTHLAGDYWTVWPAVLHAELVLRERGEARHLWGVSHRSWATRELWWKEAGERRFCAPKGDTRYPAELEEYQVGELVPVAERGRIVLLGPRSERVSHP
ncbi:MAG: hypothetical protein HYZ28_09450 [Myxococcales bacterium]|nr:hypothetical protein [Myxococcales bacterium]